MTKPNEITANTVTATESSGGGHVSLSVLPEACIAHALSLTSPEEVCRLSTVSSMFKSAGGYDGVWERFLPDDYQSIISESNYPQLLESVSTKKQLYLSLCDNPILIHNGRKSFSLEKKSGKKCCMLSARDLVIIWGDASQYWQWNSNPGSRFAEVAELRSVCWLEIKGKIDTNVLSPATWYTAHVVFKLAAESYGLHEPAWLTMGFVRGESSTRHVFWSAERSRPSRQRNREIDGHYPKQRGDGWMETELGEFFNEGDGLELEIKILDPTGHWKRGLIVEGIEIRPKEVK